jgi:hypothetical protein
MAEQEKDRVQTEADRATAEYEKRYDPSAAAVDAYRRAMSTQLRQSYDQERQAQRSYSDLYQQARRQATRAGAMSDVSGFGGGRARGSSAAMSAAEIGALSRIASQGESALRGIRDQRQAIGSNALIEAQQAEQYDRANRAAKLAETNQVLELIGNTTEFEKFNSAKKAQLRQLGITSQEDLYKFLSLPQDYTPEQTGLSSLTQAALTGPLSLPKGLMALYDILTAQSIGTTARESGLFKDFDIGDTLADIGRIAGANEEDQTIKDLRDAIKNS